MGEIHVPDGPRHAADDAFPPVPNRWIRDPRTRLWLYGVLIALLSPAVAYGLLTIEQAGSWATVAAAILGIAGASLARANVPRS